MSLAEIPPSKAVDVVLQPVPLAKAAVLEHCDRLVWLAVVQMPMYP